MCPFFPRPKILDMNSSLVIVNDMMIQIKRRESGEYNICKKKAVACETVK